MKLLNRTEMPCQELVEHASAHFEGTLSRRERRGVERHLSRCEPCRVYVEQLRQTLALARMAAPDPMPDALRERLRQAFDRARPGARA